MAGQKRTDNRGRVLKDGETQRKNGMYRFTYKDSSGERRDVYSWRLVPTDRANGKKPDLSLREKEAAIQKDLLDGIKAAVENDLTLDDCFKKHIANRPRLRKSTLSNYFYMYDHFVPDALKKKKVKHIKYSDIVSLYNGLLSNGMKPNTLEGIHTLLSPSFDLAVRDGYIRVNPAKEAMAEIKRSHNWAKPKRHALTSEEQSAFINYVSNSKIYRHWLPIFTFLLGTGCRIGEAVGLLWSDCDFENEVINISHNLIYRKYPGEDQSAHHFNTPKTEAGVRTIPMHPEVKRALREQWEMQSLLGACDTVVDGLSGFVFQNRYGDPLTAKSVNSAIRRICSDYARDEAARASQSGANPIYIRPFSVHNLRHTFCTRLCENETNIKAIQEIMGHSDIETTMNIYAEATDSAKRSAIKSLEGKVRIS